MTTVAKKRKFNKLDDTVEVLLGTMPVTLRMQKRFERLKWQIFNDDYLFEEPKSKKNFSPAPPPPTSCGGSAEGEDKAHKNLLE